MNQDNNTSINNVSPEVLELLTDDEKESLQEFTDMGIDINQYINYSSQNDDDDDIIDDEPDDPSIVEEDDDSENVSNESSQSSLVTSNTSTVTDQDISDMFSDF